MDHGDRTLHSLQVSAKTPCCCPGIQHQNTTANPPLPLLRDIPSILLSPHSLGFVLSRDQESGGYFGGRDGEAGTSDPADSEDLVPWSGIDFILGQAVLAAPWPKRASVQVK